jgi:hypothetical protein
MSDRLLNQRLRLRNKTPTGTQPLANGVAVAYGYDRASRITGLTYTLASTTLGNLSYTYDASGRRTGVGGSYARTGLPSAVSTISYNANNQLTKWGSGKLSYDADGRLAQTFKVCASLRAPNTTPRRGEVCHETPGGDVATVD